MSHQLSSAATTTSDLAGQPVDRLADGTPYFAPLGVVVTDGALVCCHLCGLWKRSVAAHLRVHGWSKREYCTAFELEVGCCLEGEQTRKARAAAFAHRQVFDPQIRRGTRTAQRLARSGELSAIAASAARGRPHPAQRLARRTKIDSAAIAAANRVRAEKAVSQVADRVATWHGFDSIGDLVLDGLANGRSLTQVSESAGLNRNWLSRHLDALEPLAAAAAALYRTERLGGCLAQAVQRAGYDDVGRYLHDQHVRRRRTVSAIAQDLDISRSSVESGLDRCGVERRPHTTRRAAGDQIEAQIAATGGFADIAAFIKARRDVGLSWRMISAECGQPESWLRRRQP